MSTIIMRVDLDCDRCYKKIRKVLCKLQDRENIKMISYDEKSNTVTVSGSFDAEEVADRLCSDAGKVITDVQVAGGNPGAKVAPKQHGKEGNVHGPGPPAHGE
uniref:HMA domain-containing protein n=1 Tax=Aegilops tauschii TaxID=37682 RepID=M8ASC1_AEGTA